MYRTLKRGFDLLASLALAPIALPLCLVLFIAIRIESPGTPLFIQWRVGRNRVPFRMLKLRTMRIETDDVPSHIVGLAQITRLGAVLRKLKLDELPQLANIFTGSMSLVGPRPCLPTQTALIAERAKRGVFTFRPGVTGAAQVRGVDMSDPVLLASTDAQYIERASFATDFSILLQTAFGSGRGDAALKYGERDRSS